MDNPFQSIDARLSNIECLLLDLKHKPQNEPAKPDLMTVPMAAEFLNLKKPTIYGLIHKGEIPNFKKGKRVYFSRKKLLAWLESGTRQTTDEIKTEANQYLSAKQKG